MIQEYDSARTLALSDPGAAPDGWAPDAVIQLSAPLLDKLMTTALTPAPTFGDDISVALLTLTPQLTLETLKIAPAANCVECLTVAIGLGGTVKWATMLGSSEAGLKVGATLDMALSIEPIDPATAPTVDGVAKTGFAIGVSPRSLNDVSVELAGAKSTIDLSGPVIGWVQSAVLAGIPSIPITEIGTETAPVRGIRISSQNQALRVDVLTGARIPGVLPADLPAPTDGFRVDVAVDSLLAIARAQAFSTGAIAHGVLGEPTMLDLRSDAFSVGLRLWRTTGSGWWRDYQIDGTWTLADGELKMSPGGVKDLGHSRGAAIADPLVALGEGILQKALGNAVNTTVPTRSGALAGMNGELVVDGFDAKDGVLTLNGTFQNLPPQRFYGGK
ncbi:MAG: hypothetical protein ABMB14_29390 [Myxococcota bacterium]